MALPDCQADQDQAKRAPKSAPKRSIIPLVEFVCTLLVLAGLLVVLPINNTVEHGYFDRLVGPIGMLDSVGTIVVVVLGALWYGLVWRLIDKRVYTTIRSDRLLLIATIWSGVAYTWLWWLCSGSMGPTGERTAIVLLGFAVPAISYYLIRSAQKDLRRWRNPAEELTRRWLRRRRIVYASLGGTVILGVLLFYVLVVRPMLQLRDLDPNASPEEIRETCHRVLRIPGGHHDAYLALSVVGDESSVPYLIHSLRWGPGPCGHGLEALWSITNQDAGRTRAEWSGWYAANRHKTRLEWIADGFAACGLDVTASPGEPSARALLSFLGQGGYHEYPQPGYQRRNAPILLESYAGQVVERAIRDAAQRGTPEEKRGALRYLAAPWRRGDAGPISPSLSDPGPPKEAVALASSLLNDPDRSVRLTAHGLLLHGRRKQVTNPPGSLVTRLNLGIRASATGVASPDGVLYLPVRRNTLIAYDTRGQRELWRFEVATGRSSGFQEPALDRGRVYSVLNGRSLYCLDSRSGAVVWSAAPGARASFSRDAPQPCGLDHLAVEVYGPGLRPKTFLSLITAADGSEVARCEGRLLGTRHSAAVSLVDDKIRVLSAPNLTAVCEIDVSGRPIGLGWTGDRMAAVLTDTDGCSSSDRGTAWAKGWSLSSGSEVYSTTAFTADLGSRSRSTQGPDGVMYVFTKHLTRAFDPADGRVVWEIPVGGGLIHAGDRLVIEDFSTITVLDARSGALLAYFHPENAGYFGDNVYVVGNQILALDSKGNLFVLAIPDSSP